MVSRSPHAASRKSACIMTTIRIGGPNRLAAHVRRHRLGYWDTAVLGGTVLFLLLGSVISFYLLR